MMILGGLLGVLMAGLLVDGSGMVAGTKAEDEDNDLDAPEPEEEALPPIMPGPDDSVMPGPEAPRRPSPRPRTMRPAAPSTGRTIWTSSWARPATT
ncbi:hypothetical protein E4L95_10555 [Paracoccus liaowanqingii]|uniref:Uncharacterized protein n=1 Tax=Paracoccus liaowanqingii TaxID=2560053 RepID=A0A4Z1CAK9_9RHOB|nr:hypothetical protein [Paracoccus liaowanqingii]TGN60499.1 hypothetical protein E4L95_10555 [Paracoccus liaowanqingii]